MSMTVFGVIIYDWEGYRTNLSEDIELHRVSRNPGGDFTVDYETTVGDAADFSFNVGRDTYANLGSKSLAPG
jgi:hypothetical protein